MFVTCPGSYLWLHDILKLTCFINKEHNKRFAVKTKFQIVLFFVSQWIYSLLVAYALCVFFSVAQPAESSIVVCMCVRCMSWRRVWSVVTRWLWCHCCICVCMLYVCQLRCHVSVWQYQYVYVMKACLKRGHEVTVMPKTCTSKDNSWLGLATYAWSG